MIERMNLKELITESVLNTNREDLDIVKYQARKTFEIWMDVVDKLRENKAALSLLATNDSVREFCK